MRKTEKFIALFLIVCSGLYIGFLAFNRSFFTFSTETDYLSNFVPEAQRLLEGKPLLLKYHPPFYSIILALFQIFTKDWLTTGLIVSLLSGILALATNFIFFYQLCGQYSGWGAIFGLISSSVFLTYSAFATSDIFFLAFYSSSLLFALLATRSNSSKLWIICGLIIGCALLTRSNALTLLLIILAPWLCNLSFKRRLTNFICLITAISVPLMIWIFFALATGSQLTPSGTHLNFAMTYFSSGNRISGESMSQVKGRFENLIQVLTYDPAHILKIYIKDLYNLPRKVFLLLEFPLELFVLPGLLFLLIVRINKEFILYLFITLFQVLLLNFKAYEERYFLFLVPLFGAAVGESYKIILESTKRRLIKIFLTILFISFTAIASIASLTKPWNRLHAQDVELKEVMLQKNRLSFSINSAIVARKPHVPFLYGIQRISFPNVDNLNNLRAFLESQTERHSLFVYYGSQEKKRRPKLAILINPDKRPEWLEVVAKSAKPNRWVLYKYKPVNQAPSERGVGSKK